MALVLNLETGLVSPQFHVSFDPSFQTVKRTFEGLPLEIKWLEAAGFTKKSTARSSTQREQKAKTKRPRPKPPDIQFSSPDDTDFQDLSPIQEVSNLPDPLAPEGGHGWYDVKEADNSDGKASGQTTATSHS